MYKVITIKQKKNTIRPNYFELYARGNGWALHKGDIEMLTQKVSMQYFASFPASPHKTTNSVQPLKNLFFSYIHCWQSKTSDRLEGLRTYSHHVVALMLNLTILILHIKLAEEIEGQHGVQIDDHTRHQYSQHQLENDKRAKSVNSDWAKTG